MIKSSGTGLAAALSILLATVSWLPAPLGAQQHYSDQFSFDYRTQGWNLKPLRVMHATPIRTGPDRRLPSLGMALENTTLWAEGMDQGWFRVLLASHRNPIGYEYGFVWKGFVRPVNAPSHVPVQSQPETP